MPFCSPGEHICVKEMSSEPFSCMESCTGLYADVNHAELLLDEESTGPQLLRSIIEEYNSYKTNFSKKSKFDIRDDSISTDRYKLKLIFLQHSALQTTTWRLVMCQGGEV